MAITPLFNTRNVNGTWTSPSFKVPDNLNAVPLFRIPILATHFSNPDKTLKVEIEISDTGSSNWRFIGGFTFDGGDHYDKDGNAVMEPPAINFSNPELFSNKWIRVKVTTNSIMNLSGELEL